MKNDADEYIAMAAEAMGLRESFEGLKQFYWRYCESPIELRMAMALHCGLDAGFHKPFPINCNWRIGEVPSALEDGEICVVLQLPIGNYRADFAVIAYCPAPGVETVRCVVECDGHAFHERTKEQAARDKARDRALLSSGWPVLRFTGSEIHKDALGCALQVSRFLDIECMRAIDRNLVGRGAQPIYSFRTGIEGGDDVG